MGIPWLQMVDRYGLEFKHTAVKLSESPGVLMGKTPKVDPDSVAELTRLHDVDKKYQRLRLEHELPFMD